MDDQERYLLQRAQDELRVAISLLPKKKDPRVTLIKEFLGADEEGHALDVLLVVGDEQDAGVDFWAATRQAGQSLSASDDAGWLTPRAREVWKARGS